MFDFFKEKQKLFCTIECYNERTKVKQSFVFRGTLEQAKKYCLSRQLWELGVMGSKESFKYKIFILNEADSSIAYSVEDVYIPDDFYGVAESTNTVSEKII